MVPPLSISPSDQRRAAASPADLLTGEGVRTSKQVHAAHSRAHTSDAAAAAPAAAKSPTAPHSGAAPAAASPTAAHTNKPTATTNTITTTTTTTNNNNSDNNNNNNNNHSGSSSVRSSTSGSGSVCRGTTPGAAAARAFVREAMRSMAGVQRGGRGRGRGRGRAGAGGGGTAGGQPANRQQVFIVCFCGLCACVCAYMRWCAAVLLYHLNVPSKWVHSAVGSSIFTDRCIPRALRRTPLFQQAHGAAISCKLLQHVYTCLYNWHRTVIKECCQRCDSRLSCNIPGSVGGNCRGSYPKVW